ncbi:hypothetical protein KSS87_002904 [Heliosperma pusillum]|nr:hypothetical protein KSS87_002904 [Heliosperma pusillum]
MTTTKFHQHSQTSLCFFVRTASTFNILNFKKFQRNCCDSTKLGVDIIETTHNNVDIIEIGRRLYEIQKKISINFQDNVSVNARVGSGEASGSNVGYGEGGEGSNVGSGEGGEGGEGSNVLTTPTVFTMSPILCYTPGGSEEWISRVEEKFTPVIGKRFVSIKKAMKFYEIYALASGFESRKSSTKRSRDGEIRTKVLLCHREGFNKRKRRPIIGIIGEKSDATSGAKSSAKSSGGGDETE